MGSIGLDLINVHGDLVIPLGLPSTWWSVTRIIRSSPPNEKLKFLWHCIYNRISVARVNPWTYPMVSK